MLGIKSAYYYHASTYPVTANGIVYTFHPYFLHIENIFLKANLSYDADIWHMILYSFYSSIP